MGSTRETQRVRVRTPGRGVMLVQGVALAVVTGIALLTVNYANWNPAQLLVLATLTIISDITSVQVGGASRIRVSGSALGLMLGAALLGGAPAALLAAVSMLLGWLKLRVNLHYLVNNIAVYAALMLAGGLWFRAATGILHTNPHEVDYYALAFVSFMALELLNFVFVVGYQCHLERSTLASKVPEVLLPVLPAELFSVALTVATLLVTVEIGTIGLALVAIVLVIFQYLVGELLTSKRRGEELQRIARTDELTGLANRERFRVRLAERIERAREADESCAVMLLALDRFKEINDTLGHHYGDQLLRELGPRLVECVGPEGLVARMGGDEFAILPAEQTDDPEVLEQFATGLTAAVQQPTMIEEMTLQVGASVGIARFPLDGDDPHALLRRADVAMYTAKDGHHGVKVYAAESDHNSVHRLSVISDFQRALERDELVVHYQPIVDVRGAEVRGAEGLVRWEHPEHGLLPPGAFIAAVEQTGLIGPLTRHVLERSIAQCATWRTEGNELSVAVNLSVRNLLDPGLPGQISALLDTYGLPADALQLEITESMIMSDPERALAIVGRLSDLGVRLSVDDFGTGYSSLANLKRLPIDELKIDRSFVSPMMQDESDLIIV
ncbi:MAG: putative bifunctional diguanylate cyclase/phosphodiesterase, partial [Solirubrobacteraceae bacterium]